MKLSHIVLMLVAVAGISDIMLAKEYQNATEAWNAGVGFHRAGNYGAAQEPFEAALKLETDKRRIMDIHRALLSSYRLLAEDDKFISSSEYILTHHEHAATKSLTCRSLISFMYQRGRINELEERYLGMLEKKENEEMAHLVLAEIYGRAKSDPKKAIYHTEQLAKLSTNPDHKVSASQIANLGTQFMRARDYEKAAEKFEEAAGLDERTASWNWKDAATAWSRKGNDKEATRCLKKAEELGPDTRSELLTYYWHKGIADVYMEQEKYTEAIPYLEKAIDLTKIDGYKKSCEELLEKAQEKAGS